MNEEVKKYMSEMGKRAWSSRSPEKQKAHIELMVKKRIESEKKRVKMGLKRGKKLSTDGLAKTNR